MKKVLTLIIYGNSIYDREGLRGNVERRMINFMEKKFLTLTRSLL